MCETASVQYLSDLVKEKEFISSLGTDHSLVISLLNQEITRVQNGGRPPAQKPFSGSVAVGGETSFVDVYNEKPIRLATKVLVPTHQNPKFNFVGKLLGPRGSSLKQLQSSSMTKMAILGRGSMRNTEQEEQLRAGGDPKHIHLHEDLHVEISTMASPAEAHARLALALSEIRAYLIPDSNDLIRHQQMREIKICKIANGEDQGMKSIENSSLGSFLCIDSQSKLEDESTNSCQPCGDQNLDKIALVNRSIMETQFKPRRNLLDKILKNFPRAENKRNFDNYLSCQSLSGEEESLCKKMKLKFVSSSDGHP